MADEVMLEDPWLDGHPSYGVPLSAILNAKQPYGMGSDSTDTPTIQSGSTAGSGNYSGSGSGSGNASGSSDASDADGGTTSNMGGRNGAVKLPDGKYIQEVIITYDDSGPPVFAVPAQAVLPTVGFESYAQHLHRASPRPGVLCPDFQDPPRGQGVCTLGEACPYIHVDSTLHLETLQRAPCCAHHGDTGFPQPSICVSLRIAKRIFRLPKGRMSMTAMDTVPSVIVNTQVCLAHLISECTAGRTCKKYHVCRVWAHRLGLDTLLLAKGKTSAKKASPVKARVVGRICTAFLAGLCRDPCDDYHVDPLVVETKRRKHVCPPEVALMLHEQVTAVPVSAVIWTKGLLKLERQLRNEPGRLQPLCADFETKQHCAHGKSCKAIHLDRAALAELPFDYAGGTTRLPTPCCWRHGDESSTRDRLVRGVLVGGRKFHFAMGIMARTRAGPQADKWVERHDICVDHLKMKCTAGATCPLYHICRQWVWRVHLYEAFVKGIVVLPDTDADCNEDGTSDCPTLLSGDNDDSVGS